MSQSTIIKNFRLDFKNSLFFLPSLLLIDREQQFNALWTTVLFQLVQNTTICTKYIIHFL